MPLVTWVDDGVLTAADHNNNDQGLQNGTLMALDSVRVFHNAAQSIADGTETALAFNSERFDTNTMHDNTTNNSRLIAKRAGKYFITATFEFDANATGRRIAFIRLNGTTKIAFSQWVPVTGGTSGITISTIYNLAVNDYVEITVNQTSGAGLNVATTANYSPEFAMMFLGT